MQLFHWGIQTLGIEKHPVFWWLFFLALFVDMAKDLLRMWNSTTLFELAHFLPLYLGLRGEDVRCGDVWAQCGWKLHLDEGFYIIFGEGGGVQAVVRVLSWNGTNYFAPANAFLILRRDCVTMGQRDIFYLFIFNQVITVEEIVVLLSSP